MKLINRESDYAMRILIRLGSEPGSLSARALSEAEKIPYVFTRQILSRLSKAGLITAKGGIKGGFSLAMPSSRISMLSVIEAMQGEFKLAECLFRKKVCHNIRNCVLRKEIRAIETKAKREFGKVTIGKLVKKTKGGV